MVGSVPGNIVDNGALTIANPTAQIFSSAISGNGTLTKVGAGTLTLGGSDTYSGGTTLSAGQLNLINASALGSGPLTISGGTIDNASGVSISLSTNPALTWGGSFTFAGTNDFNLGTGPVAMSSSTTVTVACNNLTLGGVILGRRQRLQPYEGRRRHTHPNCLGHLHRHHHRQRRHPATR